MSDLLGVQMSEGTVCDLITRCAGQLAPVEQQIKEALKEAETIHQDETGLSVAGRRHWMHVTCTPTLTHYHVDPSRGQAAEDAIGILPHFVGSELRKDPRSRKVDNSGPVLRKVSSGFANNLSYRSSFLPEMGSYRQSWQCYPLEKLRR